MESLAYNYDYESVEQSERAVGARRRASRAGERSTVLRRLLLRADVGAAVIAALIVGLAFGMSSEDVAGLGVTLVVGSVVLAFVFGLYTDRDLLTWASGLSDAPRAVIAALLLSWLVLLVTYVIGIGDYALVAVLATFATASLDGIARALARGWAHRIAPLRQRTVIVGSGVVAERLAERLRRHGEFGLIPIGLVDDDVLTVADDAGLTKLGSLDQLGDVIDEQEVDRVIIAFSRSSHQQLLDCIRTCRDARVAIDMVPRLFELLDSDQVTSQVGGMPLLSIGVRPLTRASRIAKRALDLLISATILLVLSPLLLLIAIAIRLDSRGPVLFRQVRAGRGNKPFDVFKFRSMYEDADERKRDFDRANEATDGVMFKIRRDPRITRVGHLLRRSSIDELPQLLNVFRGQMSLVGPRPLILEESQHAAQEWHSRRLDLRPGMTGLWQISGRSDLPFQEMVRFDYQYVSGWSVARDVEILFATVPAVLSGRGAY